MAHHCLDCSFKGKHFPDGACPACGSHNIEKLRRKHDEEKKPSRYHLWACAALWVYLLVAIGQKLLD